MTAAPGAGMKIAPHAFAAFMVSSPFGAQSPVKAWNAKLLSAWNRMVTAVPDAMFAEQTLSRVPQRMLGSPAMVPPAGLVIVSGKVTGGAADAVGSNLAPHLRGSLIMTRPAGAQSPV